MIQKYRYCYGAFLMNSESMAALCREFGKLTLPGLNFVTSIESLPGLRAYCREFRWLTLTLMVERPYGSLKAFTFFPNHAFHR